MIPWFNPFIDLVEPKLGSFWVLKADETKEDAEYLVLQDKQLDFAGNTFYRAIYGRSGKDFGWITADALRETRCIWQDPWASVKAKARAWGFRFEDNFDGSKTPKF
jgi:hypothetical protein